MKTDHNSLVMSFPSTILLSLTFLSFSLHAAAAVKPLHHIEKRARFEHEAVEIAQKRQVIANLPPSIPAETTTQPAVLTYVIPSPSAAQIAVTQQSQLVTSYVPQITVCALPPLAFISGSFSNPAPTGPPYLNYSVSYPAGSGTCLTTYSPTITPICYTVLDGIATRITVSECSQLITFSSDVDFALETPQPTMTGLSLVTPAPYVRPVATYYVAPWDELTPGETPNTVEIKVCTTYMNGTTICMDSIEVWRTEIVTWVTSITSHIDLTTTVSGPARVMVETYHLDVTATKTLFALSTQMGLEYEFETLTTIRRTSSGRGSTTTVTSTSTNTITRVVVYNTPEPEPRSSSGQVKFFRRVKDLLTPS
jgi:hypothetical protein